MARVLSNVLSAGLDAVLVAVELALETGPPRCSIASRTTVISWKLATKRFGSVAVRLKPRSASRPESRPARVPNRGLKSNHFDDRKHQRLIGFKLRHSPIYLRNQNDRKESNDTAKTLHLPTAYRLKVAFRPWLSFQLALTVLMLF